MFLKTVKLYNMSFTVLNQILSIENNKSIKPSGYKKKKRESTITKNPTVTAGTEKKIMPSDSRSQCTIDSADPRFSVSHKLSRQTQHVFVKLLDRKMEDDSK